MDQTLLQILNTLGIAAACVQDDSILWCTQNARMLGVYAGMPIQSLLPDGTKPQALASIRQLSLPFLGSQVYAQVFPTDGGFLLILMEDSAAAQSGALAQTAKALRSPLNEILSTSRSLFERLEEQEDTRIQSQTAKLNHSYYRILRTANALSELNSAPEVGFTPCRMELTAWLCTVMEKATSAAASVGKTLQVTCPSERIFSELDPLLMEQALWCLLSNALRYSPPGCTVSLSLKEENGHCLFTMRNPTTEPVELDALASGFHRQPSIADGDKGLGLGLLRVHRIVSAHGGVALFECAPDGCFAAHIRLPSHLAPGYLRSSMPHDPSGGYSRMLVELAELLPDSAFDSRNL